MSEVKTILPFPWAVIATSSITIVYGICLYGLGTHLWWSGLCIGFGSMSIIGTLVTWISPLNKKEVGE